MSDITLNSDYSQDNIFAKILRGEIPNTTVYEDDYCLAFMDIMPMRQGHTLVIPKEPAVTMLGLSESALQELISTTRKVANALQQALNLDGFTIAQLNGSAAGQTVPHIHFHIIPGSILGGVPHAKDMADGESLEQVAAKIRAYL